MKEETPLQLTAEVEHLPAERAGAASITVFLLVLLWVAALSSPNTYFAERAGMGVWLLLLVGVGLLFHCLTPFLDNSVVPVRLEVNSKGFLLGIRGHTYPHPVEALREHCLESCNAPAMELELNELRVLLQFHSYADRDSFRDRLALPSKRLCARQRSSRKAVLLAIGLLAATGIAVVLPILVNNAQLNARPRARFTVFESPFPSAEETRELEVSWRQAGREAERLRATAPYRQAAIFGLVSVATLLSLLVIRRSWTLRADGEQLEVTKGWSRFARPLAQMKNASAKDARLQLLFDDEDVWELPLPNHATAEQAALQLQKLQGSRMPYRSG